MKIAFVGFRHAHGKMAYRRITADVRYTICDVCEEDPETRAALRVDGIPVTHDSHAAMLAETSPDVVVVCDRFDLRGSRVIEALRAGCHVIADKPLCTSLAELNEIETLAIAKARRIGLWLTLRELPFAARLREILTSGEIGEIYAVNFTGQHPLLLETRPSWMFDPAKQGGTINDLAIHGIDFVTYVTGLPFARALFAVERNAFARNAPAFGDTAQFIYQLTNGCTVTGDASYSAPDGMGYALPSYWRFDFWGTDGMVEVNHHDTAITVVHKTDKAPCRIDCADAPVTDVFASFFDGIAGKPCAMTNEQVIASTRAALTIEQAAHFTPANRI